MSAQIEYRQLKLEDCPDDLLSGFNRYQEVTKCWRKEGDEWVIKDDPFVDDWDDADKRSKTESIRWCIDHGGYVFGAFSVNSLIGIAQIGGSVFGVENDYINLGRLHVSYEYRNQGIGRRLFNMAGKKAAEMGAKKLYISSHPSVETQAFYKSAGCVHAMEINLSLAEEEPFDCQLECLLEKEE